MAKAVIDVAYGAEGETLDGVMLELINTNDVTYRVLTLVGAAAGWPEVELHGQPSELQAILDRGGYVDSKIIEEGIHVLVIERGSEAWVELAEALHDAATYKISVNERVDGIAVKTNEFMWSTTLKITI